MYPNWHLTITLHEQRLKEIERNADVRRMTRAQRQPKFRINIPWNRLRGGKSAAAPDQEQQATVPNRRRGATA